MLQWSSDNPLFCMLCGIMFENKVQLTEHLSVDHRVQCDHCGSFFADEGQLFIHLAQHDSEILSGLDNTMDEKKISDDHGCKDNTKYKVQQGIISLPLNQEECPLIETCSRSFNKNINIKRAKIKRIVQRKIVKMPTQSKPIIKCELCLALFSRTIDLKKHNLEHHSSESDCKGNINCTAVSNKRHESETKDENKYVNQCDDDYSNSKDWQLGVKIIRIEGKTQVQSEEDYYSCPLCDYVCKEKHQIRDHRRKTHSVHSVLQAENGPNDQNCLAVDKNRPFSCNLCNCSYATSSYLQRHIIVKHGEESLNSQCVVLVDDIDNEIVNEAKRNVNGTTVYHCDICGKNLFYKYGFVRHIRAHSGEKPFSCHICRKKYATVKDLSRHLRFVHEKIKKSQCDICDRYFSDTCTRDDHRRTHTGERPYLCQTCGKSFPSRTSIYLHRRTHTNYFPHSCVYCNKKFRTRQRLTNHTRTHTGEKPFICDVCGKSFSAKEKLSRHQLTHSTEKPYECPECMVCFGQKRYLKNHMKTHHSKEIE